ncbi:hypothetical protein NDI39_18995 [Microcoleus sp. ZQ-A2]|nr:hypothetical protein [Microcoleus sp. FACHB-1]
MTQKRRLKGKVITSASELLKSNELIGVQSVQPLQLSGYTNRAIASISINEVAHPPLGTPDFHTKQTQKVETF